MGERFALSALSFNIHHGADASGRIDLDAQAQVIRASGADLVFLQEVDRGMPRSGGHDQLAELARRGGFTYSAYGKTLERDGGEYGNGLLSRFALGNIRTYPIALDPQVEPRGLLYGHLELALSERGGIDRRLRHLGLHVIATHFPRRPADRLVAARTLIDLVATLEGPVLVGGDLNIGWTESAPGVYELGAYAHDQALTLLREVFSDSSWFVEEEERGTYPAHAPAAQLDYFLLRSGRRRTDPRLALHEVLASDASDHRPLLVGLYLERESPR